MKRTITVICAILLISFLLVPMVYEADDGGTRQYVAPLYSVTRAHSLHTENGANGYLTGTIVRVLFFEVYDDVIFVPDDGPCVNPDVIGEI